jgi:hypothetical protein
MKIINANILRDCTLLLDELPRTCCLNFLMYTSELESVEGIVVIHGADDSYYVGAGIAVMTVCSLQWLGFVESLISST